MSIITHPYNLVNSASGLLLIALGLGIARLRPRRGPNLALATFCVAFGISVFWDNLLRGPDTLLVEVPVNVLANVVAVGALIGIGLSFPHGRVAHARAALTSAALAFGLAAVGALFIAPVVTSSEPGSVEWLLVMASRRSFFLALAGYAFVLVMFAWRAGEPADHTGRADPFAVTSAALVLLPGVVIGGAAMTPGGELYALLWAPIFAVLVVLWLRNGARAPTGARAARNMAWLCVAAPLAGMIFVLAVDPLSSAGGPQYGIARALGVLVLAHAILRHQLLGIDVKVKWTLKQSTVAAFFLVVFFAASEGAQALFSDQWGVGIGIAAASGLLFAIHPLQHLAQRVADKAMPGVKAAGDMTGDERRATYRELARIAWADRNLSADERAMLDGARERLGLTIEEAHGLEREAAAP